MPDTDTGKDQSSKADCNGGTPPGGFQRGPQPSFGTRPCLQGIVCYTSAEGIGDGCQPDVLLMLSAAWMQIVFQQRREHARTITAAEVYRSPSRRLRSIGFTPCENLCYNGHNHT